MKQIREWFALQKEKSKEQRRKDISDTFQAKEMDDTFCIMHNGDVIQDFSPNSKISDVITELKKKRETALKYARI